LIAADFPAMLAMLLMRCCRSLLMLLPIFADTAIIAYRRRS